MEPPAPVPFSMDSHKFIRPVKVVKTTDDMAAWEPSKAYTDYVNFILSLNKAVTGKSLVLDNHPSSEVNNIMILLNSLFRLIDQYPPIDQPQRFGNKAFRHWYNKLTQNSAQLLANALDPKFHAAIPEIRVYLEESFGNATRIDYGTGHELSFTMFLCCLFKINALRPSDRIATVCNIFNRYLELVRTLQHTYKMEPAGSHGVWSLDDFQFLPFVWGSSQLIGNNIIEPEKFLDEAILEEHTDDFMFLQCIRNIQSVKTGPFAEHSYQLWSITAVQSWKKINNGLLKMYSKEILAKFPVVQHIMFGSLFTIEPNNSPKN